MFNFFKKKPKQIYSSKEYVIVFSSYTTNKKLLFIGTIPDLTDKLFDTLYQGSIVRKKKKINLTPKTITSLITSLNNSMINIHGTELVSNCYSWMPLQPVDKK